jgi:FkbM family methyltransferase
MDISKINDHGSLKYRWTNLVDVIYQELVIKDEYHLKWARHNLPRIKTIVDIGGNLGMFAIFARELFPDVRIVSVEPCKDTYMILEKNTAESNIEIYNFAMGNGSRLYLNKCPDHSGGNQMVNHVTVDDVIGIESYALSSIFDMLQIEAPYVVKIDIEGGEVCLFDDVKSSDILKEAEYVTMEFHLVGNLSHDFNIWVNKTFNDFDVSNVDAVYSMTRKR